MSDKTLFWCGKVNQKKLDAILSELNALSLESTEITVYIDTLGGSASVAFTFYNFVKKLVGVKTIGLKRVHSAGIILFLAGQHRAVTADCTMNIHEGGEQFERPCRVPTNEIRRIYEELIAGDAAFAEIVAQNSAGRLTPEKVLEMMRKDTVLTATQLVEYGLAHEIIS